MHAARLILRDRRALALMEVESILRDPAKRFDFATCVLREEAGQKRRISAAVRKVQPEMAPHGD